MNKFKFYFAVLFIALSFSCSKDDNSNVTLEPPRDYGEQYKTDIDIIENYLKSYYFEVVNKPGFTEDQDVKFTKIPTGGTQNPIWWYLNVKTFPKLLFKVVKLHNIEYKLYYLVLREGKMDPITGEGGVSPCNIDGIFTSYKGAYLSQTAATTDVTGTYFEEVKFPQKNINLNDYIRGWKETFPIFKTGTSKISGDGTVSYYDFGAGVMFLPSGLAFYNLSSSAIPAYSPLIFSFKLYNVERLDHDNDGIPSYLEDLDEDGYIWLNKELPAGVENPDDITDNDGIPNAFDVDDDGDNYATRVEIQYVNPLDPNKVIRYYPYDGVSVDDPLTLFVDERQGIPEYSATGTPDYITPTRTRIHLDKEHHTAKP